MPYGALPDFMVALRRKPAFGRLALELLILTGVRSQEVRLATRDEFDFEGRLWAIPADHMKRRKAHMVPLSEAALAVLAKAHAFRLPDTDVVFPDRPTDVSPPSRDRTAPRNALSIHAELDHFVSRTTVMP